MRYIVLYRNASRLTTNAMQLAAVGQIGDVGESEGHRDDGPEDGRLFGALEAIEDGAKGDRRKGAQPEEEFATRADRERTFALRDLVVHLDPALHLGRPAINLLITYDICIS